MLNHVLTVVTNAKGADAMLAHTKCMAKAVDGRITLLRLLNPLKDHSRSTRIVDPLDWHIRKLEVEAALNQMAKDLRVAGFEVMTAVLEGADAELLVQYAESNGVDMMLLAKGPENVGDFIHAVLKRTTLPVVVLPADEAWFGINTPDRYHKVMIPLDGSQRAEVILSVATALVHDHDPLFMLVHVVSRPEMPRHAPPKPEEVELVDRLVELNRAEAARYLEAFAARMPGTVETRLIVGDDVASSLHEAIVQEGVDLILVSAHGYTGKPQWPYGGVTANLITYSSKPVLVVQDLPLTAAGGASSVAARLIHRVS